MFGTVPDFWVYVVSCAVVATCAKAMAGMKVAANTNVLIFIIYGF